MRVKQFFQIELASKFTDDSVDARFINFRLSTIVISEKGDY